MIDLHGAADVDLPSRVARRLDRLGEFDPETIAVGQAHDADAVDRAFEVAGELRDQRIGLAACGRRRSPSTPRA